MNPRSILMLVAALCVAGLTAFMVRNYLASQATVAQPTPAPATEPGQPAIETASILVAKEEIPTGTFVHPDQLEWQAWPEDNVRDDYIVRGEGTRDDLIGSVTRAHLFPGEPITAARLVNPGDRGFLAAVLEPGTRAVSVPINATSGVGGFVFPGDNVDVILSFDVTVSDQESGTSEQRYFGETVLTDVRVLAVDQKVDNEQTLAKVAKTATLEVTPKQAEKLTVALEIGDLSLSLHSLARVEPSETEDGTQKAAQPTYTRDIDVLGMYGKPAGLPHPFGVGETLSILRGSEAANVRF